MRQPAARFVDAWRVLNVRPAHCKGETARLSGQLIHKGAFCKAPRNRRKYIELSATNLKMASEPTQGVATSFGWYVGGWLL
jgi:hypothetical protein